MFKNRSSIALMALGTLTAVVLIAAFAPSARSQISSTDINSILNQLTGGSTSTTGTSTGTTGTSTGTGTTTTAPASQRGPQIITNQFTTVQSGSLAARAPGLWTQQAISFRATGEPTLSGNVPNNPSFFEDTLRKMFSTLITSISNFLTTLNLGASLGGLGGGGSGGTGFTPISNAATSGTGTVTPIP